MNNCEDESCTNIFFKLWYPLKSVVKTPFLNDKISLHVNQILYIFLYIHVIVYISLLYDIVFVKADEPKDAIFELFYILAT